MLYLVFTTGACNLNCGYCGGSFERNVVPWKIKYDLNKLKAIIESDNEATVIFYGGEPLINYRYIMEVMDSVRAERWGIQTNGMLMHNIPEKYWKMMDVILLSIDGRKQVTDKARGLGVYDMVLKTLYNLKKMGSKKIIARMVATEDTDIYIDAMHLLNLGFDLVHWQLNVIWSKRWNFMKWANESYKPGISRLVNKFLIESKKGKAIGLVPILGVLTAYLYKPFEGVPCGAGYNAVAISTDGRILSCPIAVYEKWANIGHIKGGFKTTGSTISSMCVDCDVLPYCGGRCLYSINEGLGYWGRQGMQEVDEVTKFTVSEIIKIGPAIRELLNSGIIKRED
ncbi:MAG: TIGR04084 family radical SAM/SPASM domain-containing protein, partial [Conexivisphaerales archaeon]